MFKKLFLILLSSFILNVIWENLHVVLYTDFGGQAITEFVLVRASARDAIILTILSLPFFYFVFLKKHKWLIIPICALVSIGLELHAIKTGRWGYSELMPLIPFVGVGISPVLQLGLIGFLVFSFVI
ncbi:MAG: hypothetical protein V4467_04280 [Patescibacteria group bacterium]